MSLMVTGGTYAPAKGTEIVLYDTVAEATAFGGVVFEVSRDVRADGTRVFDLVLVGYEAYADRRRAFGSLASTTSGAVVAWLISTYLAEYGVTAGTIETGSEISEITYSGQSVSEALNELAKIDGYTWYIDVDKKLHYISRESYAAPFDLGETYFPVLSFKTVDSLDGYRNREWFRASENSISDIRTESQLGDGVRREFKLTYDAHSDVSVKVNGVTKTIGILGVSSGYDFYWNQGSDIITQDDAGTLLTTSDTLSVTYRGSYPLALMIEDTAAIATRAAAEGNSGIYEALDEDSSCQFLNMALDKSETFLRQNPWNKANITYTTDVPGLRAGMLQSISRADYGIDTTFLITSVEAEELPADGWPMRYTVSGVSGERADDWLDFYRQLSQRTKYNVRQDETIRLCLKLEAAVTCSSVCSVSAAPAWLWGTDGTDSSLFDGGDAWW